MFDDLKIRSKLIILVAGPIIIIVLLGALGARSRQDRAADGAQVANLVQVAHADGNVVTALQREALYSTAFVGSERKTWAKEVAAARKQTDAALATAIPALGSARDTSAGVRSTGTLATDGADKLTYIRTAVDQGYSWDQVATTYASIGTTFLAVNDAIAESLSDPQVASELRTGAALAA
ncbi:MAG: Nitrate and nitrite sensing, partial [Acidimicrobiales bacterium]|nr:Nitrate and nitrite sensing [Acidimicrobiales bacterium]